MFKSIYTPSWLLSENCFLDNKDRSRKKNIQFIHPSNFQDIPHNKFPVELQMENLFYPIFSYEKDDCKIITSDFSLLKKYIPPLRIELDNLRDFVLFNTNLGENTFFSNIKRIFEISSINIEDSLTIVADNTNSPTQNVFDTFTYFIGKEINHYKNYKHLFFLSGGGESRINAAIKDYYQLNGEFITWGHPKDKEYLIARKIANKLKTPHHLIRPVPSEIPYREFMEKSGYASVIQHAYRYYCVKLAKEIAPDSVIWTGWGDINGFPALSQPTEIFSSYLHSLFIGQKTYPKGWNEEWLREYDTSNCPIHNSLRINNDRKAFNEILHKELAPRIYGQVLATESLLGEIIAPWFTKAIFNAVKFEEDNNNSLISNKKKRTLWKGDLYFRLINHYSSGLNYTWHAKGYYPFLIQNRLGVSGLFLAALSKKINSYKKYPFDSVEDKAWMVIQLKNILGTNHSIFDKKQISQIIANIENWKGNDIFEYFKLIQISWLLNDYYK